MKSSYLLAAFAALVMIGGQSITAQAQEYGENSGVSANRHVTAGLMHQPRAENFYATTARPAIPSDPADLGFIGSSEAGN